MTESEQLVDLLGPGEIERLALPSNIRYGTAIFDRGGVEFIAREATFVEAWVGGLSGTVSEGAGQRRRTILTLDAEGLTWQCAGNPKNHQIFCKHCVALALAVQEEARS
jgi:uncharacterized Zn finger protein